MFEKIAGKIVEIHTIEVTSDKSIDKAFYVYDYIQHILDSPYDPIVVISRKASFSLTTTKYFRDDKFTVKWSIAGRKRDIDELFRRLAKYENAITDAKIDPTEDVIVWLDGEIKTEC